MDKVDAKSSVDKDQELQKTAFKAIRAFSLADPKTAVVLNFKDLQLLRIKDLQQKLFDHQMRFSVGGITPERWEDTLKSLDEHLLAYVNALRNYEYLSKNTRNVIPKGFELFGAPDELEEDRRSYSEDGALPFFNPGKLKRIDYKVKDWIKYARFPEKAHGGDFYIGSFQYREIDGYGLEERSRKERWRERLRMALFGGAALIGPTLIMSLSPGRTTSLVTASLATLLFALALAKFATTSTGKDVLGATAAYAAVLVVFVGTSSSPPTSTSS